MNYSFEFKNEWVYLEEIPKLFTKDELNSSSLYPKAEANLKRGYDISTWFKSIKSKHKNKNSVLINVGYLKGIYNERMRIQNEATSIYYKLLSIFNEKELTLIKAFSTYRRISYQNSYQFIMYSLFRNYEDTSLSNMRIAPNLYYFKQFGDTMLLPIAFDSIDEEYDYYEALKLARELQLR